MAETYATILIPDISGFTEFITTTELGHSTYAINMLIDAMVNAVGEEYEVSEIEGDAVLLIKKGPAPSKKEILDTCLKIFNAFHFQRKWMQQHTICPCGACQAIINLSLKFVAHHGPVAEIKVGRFIKQSGSEMIIAHRLLKNSIDNNEYLLITDKLIEYSGDASEPVELEWASSSEEYASIGKVNYSFALLNEARKKVPEPPALQHYNSNYDHAYYQMPVAANFFDVYMVMMNVAGRDKWMPELLKIEQDHPNAFIGSIHYCTFEDYECVISPLRMTSSDDGIVYAETCTIKEMGLSLVHEFLFKKINDKKSSFGWRFMNAGETPLPEKFTAALLGRMQKLAEALKTYCERM